MRTGSRPRPRPGRGRKPGVGPLTRRVIAEAALKLIDAEGMEQLSMRRLGAELGVEAMALYHHFRDKGELLDGVLELMVEELEPPPAGSMPPMARLRAMFESSRQLAIKHPHAFILLPTRRFNTQAQFDFYERLLEIFREAGFDDRSTAHFFRLLASVSTGAGMAEVASRAQQADATPVKLEQFREPERYPLISAIAPHLTVSRLEALYKVHLDIVFDAMAAWLKKKSKAR